jgi:N-acetylneuraminic acid mutarotase
VGVAVLDGRVYVLGGLDRSRAGVARVERYDPQDDAWTTLAPLPRALHHVGAASAGGRVFSIGGFRDATFSPVADVYRYDPGAGEWTAARPLPSARGAIAAAELGGRIHAVAGAGAAGDVDDHAVYDPADDRWTPLPPLPARLDHLAAAALDGFLYVSGGRERALSPALYRYDPLAASWRALAAMAVARSGHAMAAIGGRLVVMGGETNASAPSGVFPQIEIYDPAADAWTTIDAMPVPRHGIGAGVVDGRIFVPGGATRAGFDAVAHHDALQLLR